MMTRPIEIASARSTSRSEARIVVVRSIATVRSIAPEICVRNSGRIALTRSTVSMMLAPGWRVMISNTDARPFIRPSLRKSCTESTTCAMSERRTALPPT